MAESPGSDDGKPPSVDRTSRLSGASDGFGFEPAVDPSALVSPGDLIGPVRIVRLLDSGGMGVVYEATQENPARQVALKLLRLAHATPVATRRFALEASLLARLQHPHIAQIYVAGLAATPAGEVPYLVMELVADAASITEYSTRSRLSVRDRVALFSTAVAAVAHAHRSGVVHRDLKPGNILVNEAGSVRVIDFGVARLLSPETSDRSLATRAGELVGTVRYMSPEQLGLDQAAVDPRSDVYSLGLVLHELLFGDLPYELRGRTLREATAIVGQRSTSEVRPFARRLRGRVAASDATPLAVLLATCLEPEASRRYADAGELHSDLDRWLAGEPIRARPPSLTDSVRRLVRRHRAAAVAAATVVATLLTAVAGIGWFSLVAERQRQAAEAAKQIAEQALGEAEAGRRRADAEARETRRQLYLSTVLLAAEARDRGNLTEARRLLSEAVTLTPDSPTETPELDCLAASLDEALRCWTGTDGTVQAVAWPTAESTVAIGTADGRIWLWDPQASATPERHKTGPEPQTPLAEHDGPVWAVEFSPRGDLLASASADETVRITAVPSGARVASLEGGTGPVYGIGFSPDGRRLASGSRDGTVRLWNTATWEEEGRLEGHSATVFSVSFAADGRRLLSTSRDGTARVWNLETLQESLVVRHGDTRVFRGAFAPQGDCFATAGEDGAVRIWDAGDGRERGLLRHPLRVNAVAFAPAAVQDESRPRPSSAPSAAEDTAEVRARRSPHPEASEGIRGPHDAAAPDGHRLVTASGDGLLRVWDLDRDGEPAVHRGHAGGIWSLAIRGDGLRAVTGSVDGSCRTWNLEPLGGPTVPLGTRGLVVRLAPAGDRLAVGQDEGRVAVFDPRTLRPILHLVGEAAGRVNDVVVADDGGTLLAACDDGAVRRWSLPDGTPLPPLSLHRRRIYALALSPDGTTLATASEDRSVRLVDPLTGSDRVPPIRHGRRVLSAAFHPGGQMLATACEDRIVRLWTAADGGALASLAGHTAPVNWVCFSPDGSRLASASSDGTVRLWPADGAGDPVVLAGPARQVWKVAFSPGGARVAACSADGTVQMWDASSGRPVATLRGHRDQVWGVAFATKGRGLFSVSWDGTLHGWGLSPAVLAGGHQIAR